MEPCGKRCYLGAKTRERGAAIRHNFNRARTYVAGSGLGPLLVRAVAGSGVVRLAGMFGSFVVGVLLARGLGVEGYGYYGLAVAVITIAAIPGELGLATLVTREVAAAAGKENHGALFGIIRWAEAAAWKVSAVGCALVGVLALVLLDTQPVLATALLFGAPIIPLMTFARIRGGVLQGLHFIVRGQQPANLLRPGFFSVLLASCYVLGIAVAPSGAMLLNSLAAGATLLIAHVWLANRIPDAVGVKPVSDERRWRASTIPLTLTEGLRVVQFELTFLLLGIIAAPADVGLFRIAVVISELGAAPALVLVRATMPIIARLYAENRFGQLQNLLRYSAYAQTAGVVLMSLPLLLFPEFLLSLVFGAEYAAAANALRIVALAQIGNAAFGLNAQLLNMSHHERRVTRAMGLALLVNIVTVLLLTGVWGIVGAALGHALSVLLWNVLTVLDAKRILGLQTSIFWRPSSSGPTGLRK